MKQETQVIESKYISARLATVSMSLHDSEHNSKSHHWNDSLREEGSELTWKSDMSLDLSSPKIISTPMTVPKQRHSSSDFYKMVPPFSQEAKTTRDVSFQSLKISDNSSHGAPFPDILYPKVKSQKHNMTSSIDDHSYPTVKVGTRKKSSSDNVMSPKGRKEKLTNDLHGKKKSE
jgi:hypothetical protein